MDPKHKFNTWEKTQHKTRLYAIYIFTLYKYIKYETWSYIIVPYHLKAMLSIQDFGYTINR